MDEPTDHELMQQLAAGDRAALATLVQRHQARVLSLAYRFMGRWDVAEDVAQDAFVRVLRGAAGFQPQARFTTWLYRLVANLCWDRRRQAAREMRRRRARPIGPTSDPGPPDVEAAERAERVRLAVAQLPERQRLALILHRFEGLSHREIAEVLGWSPSAVESCLVRAYETLRLVLSDLVPNSKDTGAIPNPGICGADQTPQARRPANVQPMSGANHGPSETDNADSSSSR